MRLALCTWLWLKGIGMLTDKGSGEVGKLRSLG